MHGVVGHLRREMIAPIQALDRPVTNGNIDAFCRCTIRDERSRFGLTALVKMELAARYVADGKVGGKDRREIAAQNLKEDQLETIVMRFAIGSGGIHVSRVIPPFGEVTMSGLVLWETDGR